jgi:hypothetical protein
MPHHKEKTPKTATRALGTYMIIAFILAMALAALWVLMHG